MTIQKVESIARRYRRVTLVKDRQPQQELPTLASLRLALSSTSIGDIQRLENVSSGLESIWRDGSNSVAAQASLLKNMEANRIRSEQGAKSRVPRPGRPR